jgi:hypothetical protein
VFARTRPSSDGNKTVLSSAGQIRQYDFSAGLMADGGYLPRRRSLACLIKGYLEDRLAPICATETGRGLGRGTHPETQRGDPFAEYGQNTVVDDDSGSDRFRMPRAHNGDPLEPDSMQFMRNLQARPP